MNTSGSRISIVESQKLLAIIWFIGAGIFFILLVFQTILGRYDNRANEAWSWLLPNIMPTLSLIIGVIISDTFGQDMQMKTVDRFVFRLSYLLSIAYLIVVGLTIFLSPLSNIPPLDLMKLSNLWLAPFQGLASASLGAFFVSRK